MPPSPCRARRRLFEACSADSEHAVRRRVQLKSDLWELELIILDASVKWELTAWPFMDMANVAVTHLVAGPHGTESRRFLYSVVGFSVTPATCFFDLQPKNHLSAAGFYFLLAGFRDIHTWVPQDPHL